MFWNEVSHAEPKKDEAIVNMVFVVEMKSQNPKTCVVVGERAPKDQNCGRLGKGGAIAKDFQISHPTNASTNIHNGNNPKEPTIDVGII